MANELIHNGESLQNGRYRILRPIGQGGFGITYLAEQIMMGRSVCIKEFFMKEYCIRDNVSNTVTLGTPSNKELVEKYKAKFLKEARTIARLEHPNVVKIYDVFEENGTCYYVMEYIDGKSLMQIAEDKGAMAVNEAIQYILPTARALMKIHSERIMHLDVKPANIMVSFKDDRVVLIDFGMSKQYDSVGEQTSSTPVGISHGYAPIEQYKQGGVTEFSPQSDIYALGATMYRLLSGRKPPQPTDILNDGLPPLPSEIPVRIIKGIEQAMSLRKKDRQSTIEDFVSSLGLDDYCNPNRNEQVIPCQNIFDDNNSFINQESTTIIVPTRLVQSTNVIMGSTSENTTSVVIDTEKRQMIGSIIKSVQLYSNNQLLLITAGLSNQDKKLKLNTKLDTLKVSNHNAKRTYSSVLKILFG